MRPVEIDTAALEQAKHHRHFLPAMLPDKAVRVWISVEVRVLL
jgi:hypothetical protein